MGTENGFASGQAVTCFMHACIVENNDNGRSVLWIRLWSRVEVYRLYPIRSVTPNIRKNNIPFLVSANPRNNGRIEVQRLPGASTGYTACSTPPYLRTLRFGGLRRNCNFVGVRFAAIDNSTVKKVSNVALGGGRRKSTIYGMCGGCDP